MNNKLAEKFSLEGKICIVTGAAGLLGYRHADAILGAGGGVVCLDVNYDALKKEKEYFQNLYPNAIIEIFQTDITNRSELEKVRDELLKKYKKIDVLINNAANNPKMEAKSENMGAIRFHNLPLEIWNKDIAVGLTGAFLCCQVFGKVMEDNNSGVILNISSDYGVISPDQRIYRKDGLKEEEQTVKPVSYSVTKHGIMGLTKYLATYWAKNGIRVNTLCPASLFNNQPAEFVKKISELIPMGRMSDPDEYPATILYMISPASSYMTGATVILDGGRTIW